MEQALADLKGSRKQKSNNSSEKAQLTRISPTPSEESDESESNTQQKVSDDQQRSTSLTPPPVLPVPKDTKYNLAIEVWIGKECIITKTIVMRFSFFKFEEYIQETFESLSQKLSTDPHLISFVGGRCEMRHKGLKRAADYPKSDVECDNDWEDVDLALYGWMGERFLDISVKLRLNFTVMPTAEEKERTAVEKALAARELEEKIAKNTKVSIPTRY